MRNISIKKIARLESKSLLNALRLHRDSISLYKQKSFASAYYLSAISLEELGKVLFLDDLLWHTTDTGPFISYNDYEFFNLMYQHNFKQLKFSNENEFYKSINANITNKSFEARKQNSLYVGFSKKNKKVNIHGPIVGPFQIKENEVAKQITLMNDYLKYITLCNIKEISRIETFETASYLTALLYKELEIKWKYSSVQFIKLIKNLINK